MTDFEKLHNKTTEDLNAHYKKSNNLSEEEIRTKIKSLSWTYLHKKYLEKDYDPQDSELCEDLGYSFENY